jgi:hypothetical protein
VIRAASGVGGWGCRPDRANTYIVPHYPYVMAVTDRVVTGRTPGTASDPLAAALTLQGRATE